MALSSAGGPCPQRAICTEYSAGRTLRHRPSHDGIRASPTCSSANVSPHRIQTRRSRMDYWASSGCNWQLNGNFVADLEHAWTKRKMLFTFAPPAGCQAAGRAGVSDLLGRPIWRVSLYWAYIAPYPTPSLSPANFCKSIALMNAAIASVEPSTTRRSPERMVVARTEPR